LGSSWCDDGTITLFGLGVVDNHATYLNHLQNILIMDKADLGNSAYYKVCYLFRKSITSLSVENQFELKGISDFDLHNSIINPINNPLEYIARFQHLAHLPFANVSKNLRHQFIQSYNKLVPI
jgi:hypothetical protein